MKNNFTLKKIINASFLLFGVVTMQAQIITTTADDGSPGTLRSQITNAADGAVLFIAPGVTDIILTSGEILIDKSLSLQGNGSGSAINGNDGGRIFNITSGDVSLISLTLTNGLADNGGAIQVTGADLTMLFVQINNCVANGASGSGGAIYVGTGATLTATNCNITDNIANRAGGAIECVAGTTVSLTTTYLISNNAGVSPAIAAPGNGGGLHVTGNATVNITGGIINTNIAASEGGGLWNGSGMMTVDNTTIIGNIASGASADNGGGGIYNLNGGNLMLDMVTISDNIANGAAGSGGGILSDVGTTLTIEDCTITGNTSNRAGGGIEINAQTTATTATLTNVILNGNTTMNSPGNGGGLHVTGMGTVNITGGTVNENMAGAEGGGLWNGSGTMTIEGTIISGNTASGVAADQGGGGIYNLNGGTLNIMDATISNNIANGTLGSGGGILNDVGSQLSIMDSSITGNSAIRAGGGIEDNSGTSTIMLTNVNLNNNIVTGPPGNGGGLHITGAGNIMITGGTVNGNTAALEGGGLWNGAGTMTINDVLINGNTASGAAADDGGAGIFNNAGTLTITDSTISNNLATGTSGSGGGILSIVGAVSIENSTLELNSANRAGGAIEAINGSLMLNNCVLSENDVDGTAGTPNPGNGGGIHISAVTNTTITGGYIENNEARREGGGLWNQTGSTMTVDMVTIDSNSASGPDVIHGGGGIFNNGGTLMVSNSTVSNNTSDGVLGNGGGIHIKSGDATIMTTTISTNWSTNGGGGIYNNALLSVNASTVANNTGAIYGGGVANNSTTTATLKNTIVATNTSPAGADLSNATGSFVSNGYNLIGEDSTNAFSATASDMEGTTGAPIDPMLGPLADNGGETFTHMLMTGSMAYNAGDPADQFNDQIDQAVFGGIRDIGAYESQSQLGVGDFTSNVTAQSSIYPNPAVSGFLNIALTADFGSEVTGRIVEVGSGKTVMQFSASDANNELNVNNLASGIYVVQLTSERNAESHKLIIRN